MKYEKQFVKDLADHLKNHHFQVKQPEKNLILMKVNDRVYEMDIYEVDLGAWDDL